MSDWIAKKQEQEGTYRFNGKCLVTRGVQGLLTEEEILKLITSTKEMVKEQDGIDYLLEYKRGDDRVWFIDQINDRMKEDHPPEHNYFTVLLPSEY